MYWLTGAYPLTDIIIWLATKAPPENIWARWQSVNSDIPFGAAMLIFQNVGCKENSSLFRFGCWSSKQQILSAIAAYPAALRIRHCVWKDAKLTQWYQWFASFMFAWYFCDQVFIDFPSIVRLHPYSALQPTMDWEYSAQQQTGVRTSAGAVSLMT